MAPNESPNRITVVGIDGRRLTAVAVEIRGGDKPLRVVAAREAVLPRAGLRVRRIVHPVHMEIDILEVPNETTLVSTLTHLIDSPVMQNPLLGLMPPGSMHQFDERAGDSSTDETDLLIKALKGSHSSNPMAYPRLLWLKSDRSADGLVRLRVWWARFADTLLLANVLRQSKLKLLGMVSGKRSMLELLRERTESALSRELIVNVGRLSTLFAGRSEGAPDDFAHAIPVGIERYDQNYFTRLPASWPISHAENPEELSDGPLREEFDRWLNEVAASAARAKDRLEKATTSPAPLNVFMTGDHAANSAHHAQLEGALSTRIEPNALTGMARLEWAGGTDPAVQCEFALEAGGALAWARHEEDLSGMLLSGRRPNVIHPESLESVTSGLNQGECSIYVIQDPVSTVALRRR